MSKAYLRNTIIIMVGTLFMMSATVGLLFMPMVGVIKQLGSYSTNIHTAGNGWFVISSSVAALSLSLLMVALTTRGFLRDKSRRLVWSVLLIVGIVILSHAVGLVFAAPKFVEMLKDIRL